MVCFSIDSLLGISSLTVFLKKGKKRVSILRNVSLHLPKGKTVALVGESGCGKTTLGFSITKLLDSSDFHTEGEILFEGKNLQRFSETKMRKIRGKEIGMIFQDPMSCLNPVFTIGEQMMETALLRGEMEEEEQARKRCLEVLRDVGIADPEVRMNSYPHELSGGMRQRVMIALALLLEPKLLIADEPTTALDVTVQKGILQLLGSLQKKREMAILLITHDMGVVAEVADRVAVMCKGEIVEEGDVKEIFYSPTHPYTKTLLKARLSLKEVKQEEEKATGVLVEARNVCMRFSVKKHFFFTPSEEAHVLESVDLIVKKGEAVGLVGESGSGKSTLAKVLTGLIRPNEGQVLINGEIFLKRDSEGRRKLAKQVQMVFQDPLSSLNPRKTVQSALFDTLLFHQISSSLEQARQEAVRLLEAVGLSDAYLSRYPHEMSGGQLQRVAIALALAPRPALIIFDEATSGLDVSVQAQILQLLGDLKKRFSLSYLFISHDLAVVQKACDRIYVLYLGKIMEIGGKNLFHLPKHPYTEALVRAHPKEYPDEKREQMHLSSLELPSLLHPPTGCVFRTRCPYAKSVCRILPPKKQSGHSTYYCVLDR